MKSIVLILLLSVASNCSGKLLPDSLLIPYYKSIVLALSDDSMQGRQASTIYETKAASYISRTLKKLNGFTPLEQQFTYTPKNGNTAESKNIYCYINNKADSTILIGAHYDHIGMGSGLSHSYGKTGIHPGADDNASGVAMLLGMVKNFHHWSTKKYNYIFVAYSAHELGLFGSKAFSKYCTTQFPPICLAINFDMVGRFDTQEKVLNVYGLQTLKGSKTFFDTCSFRGRIYKSEGEMIFQTDGKAYAENGISSISFTTGIHNDYHKITDDATQINYAGILTIQQLIESYLKAIVDVKQSTKQH